MSQPVAVASASLARSSPRCQPWSSLPRFPSGCSRLWSGPATKPSSEIDMWQVVSGIGPRTPGSARIRLVHRELLDVRRTLQLDTGGRHRLLDSGAERIEGGAGLPE